MASREEERAQLDLQVPGTTGWAEQGGELRRERSTLHDAIISFSQERWIFLLEVGMNRRQASTYLALHRELDWENEFDDESRSIHQYLAGLTLTVHLTLIEFGLPEPSIRLILACYGPEDAGDFVLNERHQAQTELFSRRSHLPYVD